MPIIIPNNLPANKILDKENIFVINEKKAEHQDIRPLKIAIFNIMPDKITTETQLLRLLSNNIIQIEITLLQPESHISKNTSNKHLKSFYQHFSKIRNQKFDGLIITGAPVEQIPFEEVDYWNELKEIMEWSKTNVVSTLHICWGAQAGLYYHHGINKSSLNKKMFGIFNHKILKQNTELLREFDPVFSVPQSRYAEVRKKDIIKQKELVILSESEEAGVYIVVSRNGKQIFITGHPEYDADTLKGEFLRDERKGLKTNLPKNYFFNNDPNKKPIVSWRGHANLLFSNWLNYYVYQQAPYNLS